MGNSDAAQFFALVDKMSVIVFIAAVILIIYFISRYIRCMNRDARTSQRAHRNHLVQENPSVITMPKGLERKVIEALPTFVYKPEQMKILLDCAVCLSEFQRNEKGRILPNCKHSFHMECIDMWLFSHSTCPVCRTKIEGFSRGKLPQLDAFEDLVAVSGCGHESKGQTSSCPADMAETNALPETAIGISL